MRAVIITVICTTNDFDIYAIIIYIESAVITFDTFIYDLKMLCAGSRHSSNTEIDTLLW